VLSVVFVAGCATDPRTVIGEQCELTSECEAPLVCRLSRCRRECVSSRDCALGLRCVIAPEDGLGVCLLPDERSCALDSDCPGELACLDESCTNQCVPETDGGAFSRDCPSGARCLDGNCVEPDVPLCVYPSDCTFPFVCAIDGSQRHRSS